MSKQSEGGKARAASMSPEERSRVASDAAKQRWAREDGQQVVYVIGPTEGPQKIGVAARPSIRIREIQTGNPAALKLHLELDTGEHAASAVEQRAHWILRDDRLQGEWFNVTTAEAIAAARQALADLIAGLDLPSERGKPPTSVRSIRLPDTVWAALAARAVETGESVNALVAAAAHLAVTVVIHRSDVEFEKAFTRDRLAKTAKTFRPHPKPSKR